MDGNSRNHRRECIVISLEDQGRVIRISRTAQDFLNELEGE
ncbi:hypothetical protein HMPREF1117_0965 [Streptococcus sp. SK643]|nr:hypothetical protein HMPREF1117_0965 [Streptococcus sp. SK643]